MKYIVFVSLTRTFIPWARQTISFPNKINHAPCYFGYLLSWWCLSNSPVSPSMTAPARLHNLSNGNLLDASSLVFPVFLWCIYMLTSLLVLMFLCCDFRPVCYLMVDCFHIGWFCVCAFLLDHLHHGKYSLYFFVAWNCSCLLLCFCLMWFWVLFPRFPSYIALVPPATWELVLWFSASYVNFGFQFLSWSITFLSLAVINFPLSSAVSCCVACTTASSGVTFEFVIYLCLKLTVYDNFLAPVSILHIL